MTVDQHSRRNKSSKHLAAVLKSRIMSGSLRKGEKIDSLRHIATKEGVCVNTASKAMDLLEDEGLVKKVFRKGVFVDAGPGAGHARTKMIGLLTPSIPGDWTTGVSSKTGLRAIEEGIARRKYRAANHHCYQHPDDQYMWDYVPAEEFAEYGLAGMIAVELYDSNYLSDLVRLKIPICAFDVDASHLGIDSVFMNNRRGAFELTKHFIEAGRKNIVFVGGPLPGHYGDRGCNFDPSAVERADGYLLAMQTLAPNLPIHTYHNPASRRTKAYMQTIDRVLEEVPDVDAIVTEGYRGHPEIKEIPQASFSAARPDEESKSAAVAVCDFEKMGRACVDMLAKRMEDPLRPVERQVMQPEIVITETL